MIVNHLGASLSEARSSYIKNLLVHMPTKPRVTRTQAYEDEEELKEDEGMPKSNTQDVESKSERGNARK